MDGQQPPSYARAEHYGDPSGRNISGPQMPLQEPEAESGRARQESNRRKALCGALAQEITKTRQQVNRLETVLREEVGKKSRHTTILREENNTAKEKIREQEAQIDLMKGEIKEAHTKLKCLQMKIDERDAELRKAQEAMFQQMKEGKWMPLEDSAIRSNFEELGQTIRVWVREYAATDAIALESFPPEEIEQMNYLLHPDVWGRNGKFPASLSNSPDKSKLSRLLVHTVLSRRAFEDIFNDPFYFLKDQNTGSHDKSEKAKGDHLEDLYNAMRRVGVHEAHAWRSQTLRLLNSSSDTSGIRDRTEHLAKNACDAIAYNVFHGPLRWFLREASGDERERQYNGLIDIFQTAGKLARNLWTQRSFMKTVDKRDIQFFQVDSPYMAAHRLQKLDDDDHRLDGNKVLAVIQPGIVAYGNEDGESYDEDRVWSKAIVLVAE